MTPKINSNHASHWRYSYTRLNGYRATGSVTHSTPASVVNDDINSLIFSLSKPNFMNPLNFMKFYETYKTLTECFFMKKKIHEISISWNFMKFHQLECHEIPWNSIKFGFDRAECPQQTHPGLGRESTVLNNSHYAPSAGIWIQAFQLVNSDAALTTKSQWLVCLQATIHSFQPVSPEFLIFFYHSLQMRHRRWASERSRIIVTSEVKGLKSFEIIS
jgi:hypothetical protein